MKHNKILTACLVYVGILLLFLALAYGFVPQVFSGKVLNQSDISSWKGITNEISTHNAAHPDDRTLWTNSIFGGMPTVSMYDEFEGDWTKPLYKFLTGGLRPANYLFVSLLGAFLLMLALGIDKVLAIAGAIAVTFCSYNLQIIQVGHNTKMQALAFAPWVLAGLIFTYRSALSDKAAWRKWLPLTVLGSVLFSLALSMQIKANHPQITYYLAIIILLYAIATFVAVLVKRQGVGRFFAASGLLLAVGLVGIGTNANKLIPTYEYAKYTMRGGSELSPTSDTHNDKGLDLGYATAWSYGIEETPNLLIPDFNGGASAGSLGKKSETYKLLKRAGQPGLNGIMKSLPLYWGPQPFTAGPMYMGAVTIFLFVLGLCLFRGREKWWLLVATILAILLAWGSHLMWFTRLWFEYAPMYNKFRTVSMALVILQFSLPMLGFVVLDRILKDGYNHKKVLKATAIAFGVTAGFCFVCILFPSIAGSFTSASDAGNPEILTEALAADRRTLLVKDAFRSLLMITLAAALIAWCYNTKHPFAVKGRQYIASAVFCVLVLFDLGAVGKRYLNKDHFVTKKDFNSAYAQRTVDKLILADTDPDYRVLDLSVNTFNDGIQGYYHKCIGGYSPAKLQRYQDLIERHISGEINKAVRSLNNAGTIASMEESLPYLPVLSALNCRYIVVDPDYPPVRNRNAFGNAWFVDDFVGADTPDQEIDLLGATDLRRCAVIGEDFLWAREAFGGGASGDSAGCEGSVDAFSDTQSGDCINLVHYAPNELRYDFSTSRERPVLFSEIYYPNGWKAWIEPSGKYGTVRDGHYIPTEDAIGTDLFRADWILRGAVLPQGQGTLVMRFEPLSYTTGSTISRASSILLLLLLLLSVSGAVAVKF